MNQKSGVPVIGRSGRGPRGQSFQRRRWWPALMVTILLLSGCADSSNSESAAPAEELAGDASSQSSVTAATAPANDKFADALVIDPEALPFESSVDTTGATSDADDESVDCPAPQVAATVWYSFTPTTDMVVTVSAESDEITAGISAVSGAADALELIECRPFAFTVDAQAGTTYHFQVFDGESADSPGGAVEFKVAVGDGASTEALEPFGPEFIEVVTDNISVTTGAFVFTAIDADGRATTGSTGTDRLGNAPTADDLFRIGSITKVFTALATLLLVEDGLVDLDAPVTNYVTRLSVPAEVTVRDLLKHESGIANYTDADEFFPAVFREPSRVWTPEAAIEFVGDEPLGFEPGTTSSYSNSNYTILGVLIEEVAGRPYHDVVRERILDPLGLTSTYLAGFEDGPAVFQPYEHEGAADYDYTSIATSAWAAGGMVSSAGDLHRVFTALFDGQIISDDLVSQMIDGSEFGLGLQLQVGDTELGVYGHGGGIPGYETMVLHSSTRGVTAFFASTDAEADVIFAYFQMGEGFAALKAD